MKKLLDKLTTLINTIDVDTSKSELTKINDTIVDSINSKLIELKVQKVCSDKKSVDSFKESIKNVDLKEVNDLIECVNTRYQVRLLDLVNTKSNIKALMLEKTFKAVQLNNSIPIINLYKHIESNNKPSGFIATIKAKPYTLTMLFHNDSIVKDSVYKLSYDLSDSPEELSDAISKANTTVNKSTADISIRVNLYKNCIGESSNKFYKGVLDSLVDYIGDKIDSDIKGKRFNSLCMEWLSTKASHEGRLCEFKAFKTFNADSTLYNYVKSALYYQNNFGLLH